MKDIISEIFSKVENGDLAFHDAESEILDLLSVCFLIKDGDTNYCESVHLTKESANKELSDWKKIKPSKDVYIVERELKI